MYYLQFSDTFEFKEKLRGIITQIEIFEKEFGKDELKSDRINNFEDLASEIKNNALNTNNYAFLLNFMQKVHLMSKNPKFKEFWIILDNVLKKIEKEFENLGYFHYYIY